jgi:putative transposase
MLKACKIRLYPTAKQKQIIFSQIGGSSYIFNRMLALKIYTYKKFGKNIGKYDLIKRATKLKKRDKTSWLKDIDSQVLQQSISNINIAYKNFFRKIKQGGAIGFPEFKSKHYSRQSFQYPQRVKLNEDKNKIYLPKVGLVKCKGFTGKIKTVTVSLEVYQYHASLLIDDSIENKSINHNNQTVGLDVGVKLVVADSNGNKEKALKLERELTKLRKIANKRKDFLHKLSTKYSENQAIVVEDLKIKNMSKSAKGTTETPGKNVKAKVELNRVITQQSWGIFFEMLEYKLKRNGGELIKVNPKFTSRTCPKCGYVSKENRLSQSKFVCQKYNYSNNADTVRALIILDRGIHGNNACDKIAS